MSSSASARINESHDAGTSDKTNSANSSDKLNPSTSNVGDSETWGYDLFPERKGEKVKPSWTKYLLLGDRHDLEQLKCEKNVYYSLKKSPFVRLLVSAIKSSGCDFDIRRHISCECCQGKVVTGGYDSELNQIVICQNLVTSKGMVQGVLTHELIHMFDACRAKVDFKDNKHLACSEIRAANLSQCSFLSAMADGMASPFKIAKTHQECVKNKAIHSVLAVREKLTKDEVTNIVESVFEKCYNDLEPFGRRCRRKSRDPEMVFAEKYKYGYDAEID